MKNYSFKWLLICLFAGWSCFSALAQKDILLYSTDFTDWGAIDGSGASSDDIFNGTGGGAGFTVGGRPTVSPAGTVGGYTGYFVGGNSGTIMNIKPLEYISGGVVEVLFYINNEGSTRTISLTGGTVTQVMMEDVNLTGSPDYRNITAGGTNMALNDGATTADRVVLDPAKLGKWYAGADAKVRYTGVVKVSFNLPALTGVKTLSISGMNNGKIHMVGLKVYTSAGSLPYVASTNYGKAPAEGHALQGVAGGVANTGTPANALVNIKAWNVTSDVTLSIEGNDATKFSLPVTTIPNATALAGTNVDVNFTPSIRNGIANALLKISAAGAPDYYVSLKGLTGGGSSLIVASTSPMNFWTSLIAKTTKTLDVSGLNLTGDITLSLTGAGSSHFTLTGNPISLANASAGKTITITFTGDTEPSELDATLVLSSPGAASVSIPLKGITSEMRPELYELIVNVSPAGAGYVDVSPAGTQYLAGSKVNVKATPETGYTIARWSDASGNRSAERTFTVKANRTITVFFVASNVPLPPEDDSNYVAYLPINITATGFTGSWSDADDATGYTVNVYEGNSLVSSTPVGMANTTNIIGLTSNKLYSYEVVATTPSGLVSTDKVGPIRTVNNSVAQPCGN